MKLATLRNGTRDGRLVVVSRDLTRCSDARHIAPTLQAALDNWKSAAPELDAIARGVETGGQPVERFHEHDALSPLPRAFGRVIGSTYLSGIELVRRARGAAMPDANRTDPLIYQGGSDAFLAPRDPIRVAEDAWGIDVGAAVAVVTGDVPIGATRDEAAAAIRLVMLANDVSLRELIPSEPAEGSGLFQSRPSSAFSPVAVTPEDLPGWDGAKLNGILRVDLNGRPFGRADAGEDMTFDFPALIAHAARTRPLGAGTIVDSGAVSNRDEGGLSRPVAQGGRGYCCIAEQRSVETLADGAPRTPFLRFGDTVRIEMRDAGNHAIFGAIEQIVERHAASAEPTAAAAP